MCFEIHVKNESFALAANTALIFKNITKGEYFGAKFIEYDENNKELSLFLFFYLLSVNLYFGLFGKMTSLLSVK